MFRTAPVTEPNASIDALTQTAADAVPADLIPLSHLALDLAEPAIGWAACLAERGISVQVDDVGRLSVSRADARRLFAERAEVEARQREVMERNEQRAIEADRAFRAGLPAGVPWYQMPDGVLPVHALTAAAAAERPRRTSVLQDALAHGETVMHILEPATFEDE
jgi:hypothetical protein